MAKDDRFTDESKLGIDATRKRDGDALSNDVEGIAGAAGRTTGARRESDLDNFDTTNLSDGTHKNSSI